MQRAEVGGEAGDRPLVQIHRRVVVAVAIVFHGQAEQGAGMMAVGLDGPLVERDDFAGVAVQGGDRRRPLIKILGRLFDGAGEPIEQIEGGLRLARNCGALRLGPRHNDRRCIRPWRRR